MTPAAVRLRLGLWFVRLSVLILAGSLGSPMRMLGRDRGNGLIPGDRSDPLRLNNRKLACHLWCFVAAKRS
jgi:hypothetical protein